MLRKWKRLLLVVGVVLFPAGLAHAQTLSVSSISPTSGPVGSIVTIIGLNFGESQGSSTVSLNGTNSVITSWTDTAITALVPSGGSSGLFSVVVNGESANSSAFTVTALPTGWSDGDVGSVGVGGSASYGLGTFTVKGSGQYINHSSDGMNFAYEPLSGDGTIVARVRKRDRNNYCASGCNDPGDTERGLNDGVCGLRKQQLQRGLLLLPSNNRREFAVPGDYLRSYAALLAETDPERKHVHWVYIAGWAELASGWVE